MTTNRDRYKAQALEAVGDLTAASLLQLVALYDACEAAGNVWLGVYNMPRLGYAGEDERPADVVEDEQTRLWYMQERIVAELRRRPMPDPRHEGERARVLVDWYWKGDHEPGIYADALKSLTSAHPDESELAIALAN